MPSFQDGPSYSSSEYTADTLPKCALPADLTGLPGIGLPPGSVAPWSAAHAGDADKAKAAVPDPFASQAERWEKIARRVWSGRNDAEIPQWIRRDMSPSMMSGLEMDEEAQMPLHYGIRVADMLPMERAAFASMPMAANVSLISPSTARHSSSRSASRSLGSAPVGASGQGASILQFPAGLDYEFPNDRLPPEYADDVPMPFRSTIRQTIAVFSLTGGTGRTSLSAGLARVLAGNGLRVLLADTSAHSLLPRLFGGGESSQGVLRKFVPMAGGRNQMISQVSLAVEAFAGDDVEQYRILHEFSRETASMDRILWDLGGAPLDWATKVLRISTQILVPLLPNMQSLVQLRATKAFLERVQQGRSSLTWNYVLNHFDESDAGHVDIRGRLRQLLGDQLLPETLRSSPLVDEALAKGRTVFDHAPDSGLAGDIWRLGTRIRQVDDSQGENRQSASEWAEA